MQTNKEEQRFVSSNIKISINVIIALIVTVAFLLLQFFVLDDVMAKARDLAYWIGKIISGLATFTIMISLANTTEESRKKRDKEFNGKLNALDSHYTQVFEHGEIDNLEVFVQNMNIATKYNVYIAKIKRKIKLVQKFERGQKRKKRVIEELEKKLLKTPEQVWEDEKVRYNKVTVDLLFSGVYDIEKSDRENDLHLHRGKYGVQKLGWKIVTIIAFGFMTADLVYHFNNFTSAMIVPLLIKIITILMAAYSGICFGYFMMDKVKAVLRKKLRILSKFRVRQDAQVKEKDLSVQIMVDNYVAKAFQKYMPPVPEKKETNEQPKEQEQPKEKPPIIAPTETPIVVDPPIPSINTSPLSEQPLVATELSTTASSSVVLTTPQESQPEQAPEQPKEEKVEEKKERLNPFQQTYAETFGEGKPVKIGKFGVTLAQNLLKYNPDHK
jgi:hypothetical protein